MNKLKYSEKDKIHLIWFMILMVCVVITYCYQKSKATDNYKRILQVASKNCNLGVVKLLVGSLLDIDTRVPRLTALHHTSDSGCLEVTRFLVHKGADISALGEDERWTVLHFAALEGHLEITRFLLEKGADPNIRDRSGKNPRDVAVIESRYDRNKSKPYREIIKLLYDAEQSYKQKN